MVLMGGASWETFENYHSKWRFEQSENSGNSRVLIIYTNLLKKYRKKLRVFLILIIDGQQGNNSGITRAIHKVVVRQSNI